MAEPRPCPGCVGCSDVAVEPDAFTGRHFIVWCRNCYDDADDSRPFVAGGDTREEAIAAWNEHVADELDEGACSTCGAPIPSGDAEPCSGLCPPCDDRAREAYEAGERETSYERRAAIADRAHDEHKDALRERLVSDTEPTLSADRDTREPEPGLVLHFPGGSVDTTGWPATSSGKTSRATPEELAALEGADTEPAPMACPCRFPGEGNDACPWHAVDPMARAR